MVVAVDVGSSSARAGVFDARGKRLARAEIGFSTARPLPDHAEHQSEEIWRAVCAAVRAALTQADVAPADVAGLAFDATCSLAMFDAAGLPVSVSTTGIDSWNVVMWADHRAVAEAEEITATGHRALDFVGGVMSPEMQVPKLLWLRRNLPGAWRRYALGLDLADFLAWRATGRITASACTVTCKWTYLAHETPGWQRDLFERLGLDDLPTKLALPPRAAALGSSAGTLTDASAAELGLTVSCVVGVGLIDAHAGGVGLLAGLPETELNRGIAMIAGTSTCHMAVSPEQRRITGVWGPYFGAMLPGLWLNEAGQSATGALLDHILDWHAEGRLLGPQRHALIGARITELLATDGPAMHQDLMVLPDFNGNRSPLAEPRARGVIHGLALDHSFDSLARLYYATAIGIALGTRHIVDALNRHGYGIDTLHLTGGHAGSPLLVRLYADATACRVLLPEEEDSVLLGTAIIACLAAGLHGSMSDAARAMRRSRATLEPNAATRALFADQYRRFLRMQDHRRELSPPS
ncbi:MAG TPA: FGGY-family carbohydrate kinase [Acetobacteraceae bacterium]|nr:FGGY-family carbohydrate kinase [Acetobacteraceae bacterium]